ncbi:MAG: transcriptional repressor [Rhodospirillaceae bacterium]|nr:transcriptional repressor [Rhodospirillaceae bacterium]|tara:strand:- start:477 stop:893 length:417 start_codon:yes stop_codon:yes gene_type:complete
MAQTIEKICVDKGLRMTGQRRTIAKVISESNDHPDVEKLHERAITIDPEISIATVYRTVRLFQDAGIISSSDFGGTRARYEIIPEEHHDHLINLKTGQVIEFRDEEIEELQKIIADKLGYKLVDHRLELYGVPKDQDK